MTELLVIGSTKNRLDYTSRLNANMGTDIRNARTSRRLLCHWLTWCLEHLPSYSRSKNRVGPLKLIWEEAYSYDLQRRALITDLWPATEIARSLKEVFKTWVELLHSIFFLEKEEGELQYSEWRQVLASPKFTDLSLRIRSVGGTVGMSKVLAHMWRWCDGFRFADQALGYCIENPALLGNKGSLQSAWSGYRALVLDYWGSSGFGVPNPFGPMSGPWAGKMYREHFRTPELASDSDSAERWRTSDTVALARGIINDMVTTRLPILGDALMDAGCEDEDVISYCRPAGYLPQEEATPPANWLTVWLAGEVAS